MAENCPNVLLKISSGFTFTNGEMLSQTVVCHLEADKPSKLSYQKHPVMLPLIKLEMIPMSCQKHAVVSFSQVFNYHLSNSSLLLGRGLT